MNSANSGNLVNHSSMNLDQFKDLLCYLCLAGTVVAFWSLTREVAGSNNLLTNIIFLSLNSANLVKKCRIKSIDSLKCHDDI